jgi:pimeloyl-ACP methyl ester carboxylesterase
MRKRAALDKAAASLPKRRVPALSRRDGQAPRKPTLQRIIVATLGILGLILPAGFAVAFILFRNDMSQARSRLASIPTKLYKSRFGDIEYRLAGEGPTVLVSHGVNGGLDHGMRLTNPDQWSVLGAGYRFLYVSRFGYLRSALPEQATARLQAAAYKELLDHLGIGQVFVFGNSAGGPSTMWFAIDYAERTSGLILHSSAAPGPDPATMPRLLAKHDFLYWAAVRAMPGMLLGLLLPKSISSTLTKREKDFLVENALMASLPISERSQGIGFDNEVSTPSVNDVPFERIQVPTLILHATDASDAEGGRKTAERIPNSEYIGLTGGHFLLRQEEAIQAATRQFMTKHSQGRR